MSSEYFRGALQRYRETRAEIVGCTPEDLDRHSLVIVPRPERPTRAAEGLAEVDPTWSKFVAMALTFGTGTVVSVVPEYIDWVRENAPKDKHYRALFPNALLQPLAEEGARRGESTGRPDNKQKKGN